MHGEVGAAVAHRHLELLDEKALAADIGERPVEDRGRPAWSCRAGSTAHAGIQRGEPRADVLGLPHARARIRASRWSGGGRDGWHRDRPDEAAPSMRSARIQRQRRSARAGYHTAVDRSTGSTAMRIVITGGAGFLGRKLAAALLARGTLTDARGAPRDRSSASRSSMSLRRPRRPIRASRVARRRPRRSRADRRARSRTAPTACSTSRPW